VTWVRAWAYRVALGIAVLVVAGVYYVGPTPRDRLRLV